MAKDNKLYTFYQHPYKNHELVFSGRFPGSPVPNFRLHIILRYADKFKDFKFRLILRDGTELSVIKEKGRKYFEIGQIVNGTLTKEPCFASDGHGLVMKTGFEMGQFIIDIAENDFWGLGYIRGN